MYSPIAPEPSADLVWFEHLRRVHLASAMSEATAAVRALYAVRADCTWASKGVRLLGARLDELIVAVEGAIGDLQREGWGVR